MPIESKTENLNWTSLEGIVLGGAYRLERFASADQNTASFDTRTGGERSSKALVRLVGASGEAGEQQLQVWQAIKKSGHPHLLPIWGTGHAQADGHDLIYVVVEAADENLAGVLGDRPLEPREGGEILVSMVGALGHLHSHGFVHGGVSPEQILAVGETVKLSTGGVRRTGSTEGLDIFKAKYRAPESPGSNITPAADIWCLGATLVEALTQHACGEDCLDAAAKLPEPFDAIAKSCLQPDPGARGTLAQILALYEGKSAAAAGGGSAVPLDRVDPAPATSEVEDEPTVPVYLAPGPIVPEADAFSAEAFFPPEMPIEEIRNAEVDQSESVAEPIAARQESPVEWRQTAAVRPEANAPAQHEIARAKRRAWIFVLIALAILVAVIWVLRPSRPGANRVQAPQKSSASQPGAKQGQTMTLPAAGNEAPAAQGGASAPASTPTTAAGKAHEPALATTAKTSPAGRGPIWRVILYTYNRAADAEKRAAIINRQHPGFGAEVFMPNGEGKGPYLVSIGGSTNREDVAQLRRNAIRAGLPHDAYLQNYSR